MLLTRALHIATRHAEKSAEEGRLDLATRQGYVAYVQSLLATLHSHHQSEDEVVFPFVHPIVPEMPVDRLVQEHRDIEDLIADSRRLLKEQGNGWLEGLHGNLARIQEIWAPHIRIEEENARAEIIGQRMTPEEIEELGANIASHQQEQRDPSVPDYLVVPFLLFNLPPEERPIMAASFPPVVTEQLVPGPWKDKWAPMKPFLLD